MLNHKTRFKDYIILENITLHYSDNNLEERNKYFDKKHVTSRNKFSVRMRFGVGKYSLQNNPPEENFLVYFFF